ncbi:MAG: DUF4389 domain-containing protein [Candidatus Berkiella sp.]
MSKDIEQAPAQESKYKIDLRIGTKEIWIRALYILFFIIAGYIAVFVTFFVMVFQFIGELIFKKPNEHLQNFGETLGHYFSALIRYITGASSEMPFPFQSWPKSDSTEKRKH